MIQCSTNLNKQRFDDVWITKLPKKLFTSLYMCGKCTWGTSDLHMLLEKLQEFPRKGKFRWKVLRMLLLEFRPFSIIFATTVCPDLPRCWSEVQSPPTALGVILEAHLTLAVHLVDRRRVGNHKAVEKTRLLGTFLLQLSDTSFPNPRGWACRIPTSRDTSRPHYRRTGRPNNLRLPEEIRRLPSNILVTLLKIPQLSSIIAFYLFLAPIVSSPPKKNHWLFSAKDPSQMAMSSGALLVWSFWCHCSMNLHSMPGRWPSLMPCVRMMFKIPQETPTFAAAKTTEHLRIALVLGILQLEQLTQSANPISSPISLVFISSHLFSPKYPWLCRAAMSDGIAPARAAAGHRLHGQAQHGADARVPSILDRGAHDATNAFLRMSHVLMEKISHLVKLVK